MSRKICSKIYDTGIQINGKAESFIKSFPGIIKTTIHENGLLIDEKIKHWNE